MGSMTSSRRCTLLLVFCTFVAAQSQEWGLDGEDSVRKIRQPEQQAVTPMTIAAPQMCGPDECNSHGTCLGTKTMPFCICQLGFAGSRCQESYCDSQRECNGHGWCMGTTSQFTCLCNLGYSGTRCEVLSPAQNVTLRPPVTPESNQPKVVKKLAPEEEAKLNEEDEKEFRASI